MCSSTLHPTPTQTSPVIVQHVGFFALTRSSANLSHVFCNTVVTHFHLMVSTNMTKDKVNIAVLECICKSDRTKGWLRNCDDNITTLSKDAGDNTVFKVILVLKAMIGTHEFAHTNYMLMQPDGSTLLTTYKRTVVVFRPIVAQLSKLLHKTNPREMLTHNRWNDSVAGC